MINFPVKDCPKCGSKLKEVHEHLITCSNCNYSLRCVETYKTTCPDCGTRLEVLQQQDNPNKFDCVCSCGYSAILTRRKS